MKWVRFPYVHSYISFCLSQMVVVSGDGHINIPAQYWPSAMQCILQKILVFFGGAFNLKIVVINL